jgi:serine phosphatase RsbU (regulator of sigma subunit)
VRGFTEACREAAVTRIIRSAGLASAILFVVLELFGMRDFVQFPYTGVQHSNLVVTTVERDSPNRSLGLKFGDRILRVNGVPIRNVNHYSYLIVSSARRPPLVHSIARGDSLFNVPVQVIPQPAERLAGKFSLTIVGFTFVLVGLIVVMKRPDIMGILFTASCYILSLLVTERPVTAVPLLHIIGELAYDFLFIFLPAFLLHFFLLFPGREIERGTRRALLLRFLYAPAVALALMTFAAALRQYGSPSSAGMHGFINTLNTLTALYWVLYIIASLSVFVRTYVIAERVQRIKFRIAIVGVAVGIIPLTVLMLLKQFHPTMVVPVRYLWPFFLSFMSISFAYAILKHDAFDLGIVARKSLVYVLLLGFVLAVYYASVNVLGDEIGRRFGVPTSVVTAVAIVLLAVAIIPVRAGFQRLVDRFFARSHARFTDEVVAFSRQIQFLLSLEDVACLVARQILGIFQADHAQVFLRGETGAYELRESVPDGRRAPLTSFPPGTALIRLMKLERVPLMLEYYDRLWIKNNLDRISQELIALTHVSAAVPLLEQDELLGFILVGRKASGRPYTRADAEIFELLAERSAVAIMNINLCGDSIVKKRLEEELRLASEIQKRLLPAAAPALGGATIVGKLLNSREVGGDFYDFIEFEPGVTGIAIADVSGKGIPAALLMTTLQASFRSEAIKASGPAAIISALNTSLYERSDPEKFATFFCAIYEDANGLVRFSNAGSYPPFIISSEGRISRLHRGGVLIGLDPASDYREGIVKLRAEDLLVMFTDGCIDQEDDKGEPFGEKRLVEFFRNNIQLSVDAMIEKLFATIIAFGQQNLKDDMTVVLLRRNKT